MITWRTNTGRMSVTSGRCVPPRYGSFRMIWSPSRRVPGKSRIAASTATGIEPRWTGMCSAWATMRPSASKSAQLALIRSLMFGEYAVRRSATPISSGMNDNPVCRISRSAGSRRHLDLDEPARTNAECRSRRHYGRRVVLRDNRGTRLFEPNGDRFAVEHGDLRPSVIEQDPPTGDPRRPNPLRPREGDAARDPNLQTHGDEFDPFFPRGISVPPAVLPPECAREIAANRDVDLVALSLVPKVEARLDHRLEGIVVFLA